FHIPAGKTEVFVRSLAVLLAIKMVVFWPFQLYEGLWRYISMRDILSIFFGASAASVVFGLAIDIRAKGLPLTILILAWVFTLALSVDEILIAIPSVSDPERVRIIESAREAALPLRSVPSLRDLFTGRATIGQLRDVRPQDVLGRQAVWLDVERLRREVTGR